MTGTFSPDETGLEEGVKRALWWRGRSYDMPPDGEVSERRSRAELALRETHWPSPVWDGISQTNLIE